MSTGKVRTGDINVILLEKQKASHPSASVPRELVRGFLWRTGPLNPGFLGLAGFETSLMLKNDAATRCFKEETRIKKKDLISLHR